MQKRFCDVCEEEITDGFTTVRAEQRGGKLEGKLFEIDVCVACREKLNLNNETVRNEFQTIMNVYKKRKNPELELCDICHAEILDKSKPYDEMIEASFVTMVWAGVVNPFWLCKKCSEALKSVLTGEEIAEMLRRRLRNA